ncbi:MAG TPA: hypothetical protein VFN08_07940 [Gemmatimonadales bacterium]|jgi:hypothetical protein|nr:hypothetical protein [Gemmatimonadales bacterium]
MLFIADPSPLAQTAVYMAGILMGYLLLTRPDEWERVRETVRAVWTRQRQR